VIVIVIVVGASEQRGAVGPVHLDPRGGPGEAGGPHRGRHHPGRHRVGTASTGLRSGAGRQRRGGSCGRVWPITERASLKVLLCCPADRLFVRVFWVSDPRSDQCMPVRLL
jgi:hypothetical protein